MPLSHCHACQRRRRYYAAILIVDMPPLRCCRLAAADKIFSPPPPRLRLCAAVTDYCRLAYYCRQRADATPLSVTTPFDADIAAAAAMLATMLPLPILLMMPRRRH